MGIYSTGEFSNIQQTSLVCVRVQNKMRPICGTDMKVPFNLVDLRVVCV